MAKVLIVDDEPHLRLLYETELRRAGLETMTASNAEQALECVGLRVERRDVVSHLVAGDAQRRLEALGGDLPLERVAPALLHCADDAGDHLVQRLHRERRRGEGSRHPPSARQSAVRACAPWR